jgi:nicotinamide mononucleotide adenylyltransferase
MFEMAADYVKLSTDFELIGGYLSPVSDAYRKAGLASAEHRVAMCERAVDRTSNWLMVDTWEPMHKEYQPTAVVLDHFDYEINTVRQGIETGDGSRKPVQVVLLAGADLVHTMSTPGVWSEKDLDHILGKYGAFIVERSGTDIDEALAALQPWKRNIHVIQQLIQNDVSSTKIRLFLRRDMSVRYLIPTPVIEYIEQNGLYREDGSTQAAAEKGKEPAASA